MGGCLSWRSCALLVVLVLCLSTPAIAAPTASPTIYVFPMQAAPGAALTVQGYGFAPRSSFELLIVGNDSGIESSLGTSTTDTNGGLTLAATLPALSPGVYSVVVNNRSRTPTIALTVLAAPTISLNLTAGQPGTIVEFTVDHLLAGSLRLDYAGVPVFGPTPVAAGSFHNLFVVPQDRPAVLGERVIVSAYNLVSGRSVGRGETVFESQTPSAPIRYTLNQIKLPEGELDAGEFFTVSGRITPAPLELTGMSLRLLWKTGAGAVFPITQGTPQIAEDGAFHVQGHVPTLMAGDPAPADSGAQVGVVLLTGDKGNATLVGYTPYGPIKPVPKFIVKVVDENNAPVPNAIVDIRAPYAADATSTDGQAIAFSSAALGQNNQVVQALVNQLPSGETDPFDCPASATHGRTDANGEFAFQFDPDKVSIMGTYYVLDPTHPDKKFQFPTEVEFPLTVNALYTGHGQMVNNKPTAYQLQVRYSSITRSFYDVAANKLINTEPFVVVQPALPANTPIDVPAVPYFTKLPPFKVFNSFLGSGDPLYAFGNFLSFSDETLYPDALFVGTSYLTLRFQHDSLGFGALDDAHLTFTLEDTTYNFTPRPNYSTACGHQEYEAKILNAPRLTPGAHIGTMEIRDATGHVTKRYVQLTMIAPPAWIGDTKLVNRRIYYNSTAAEEGVASLSADVLEQGAPDSTSQVGANLNKVGQVDNAAGASYHRGESIHASGQTTKYFNGGISTEALNETSSLLLQKPAPGQTKITFGDTITLLNTGKMPLFRDVWGVPPIASATIGADMWFKAQLTYNGAISFEGASGSSYSLLVSPSGTVGVSVFLDISALMGIVSAHADASPQISFSIPATFQDGQKLDSDRCFRYRLDINWEASIGYCPLCLSDSGTKNIFKGHQPSDAPPKICSDPAVQVAAIDATPPPPDAHPALSSDGFGHTLAVWRATSGEIVASTFDGVVWSSPIVVTTNTSAGAPQVAFYAPNAAVAVWTQNGLTSEQAATADFATLAAHQHLAYALWNGVEWSAPQNLTSPTTGDGSPALAACLSTTTGCPADGAVAAIWVHDAEGDLNTRQFRLFYAIFNGNAWGSSQAVDPSSTATDSEPSIAFSAGVPWAVWVRDADRDLATLADHTFAHRKLANDQPVVVDNDLPAGPSQPSLAFDSQGRLALAFTVSTEPQAFVSNKRQLYSARQSCTPSCSWSFQALVDGHNRAIFGEGPVLTINGQDQAVITYRGLGLGSLPGGKAVTFAEDVPGVIMGTGAIAQLHVDFNSAMAAPQYLTQGTSFGWQSAAALDPLAQQVMVVAAQGPPVVLPAALDVDAADNSTIRVAAITADAPVVFAITPFLPDYAIAEVQPWTDFPIPGQSFSVSVQLLNQGGAPESGADTPELVAAWDNPPGTGTQSGTLLVPDLEHNAALSVTLPVDLPADLTQPHLLYVGINPAQRIAESNYANNSQRVTVGGLPTPKMLEGAAQAGQTLVTLSWDAVSDPRVVGYHVYRRMVGATYQPVGSTFTSGFVDLTPWLENNYEYVVSAYDDFGHESALSAPLLVQLPAGPPTYRIELPFFINEP